MIFRYLALRLFHVSENSLGERMQRNLHPEAAYDFVSGISISSDRIMISSAPSDNLYDFESSGRKIHTTINAIVGENGSGKSSIIDFIVRILNNLSAILLGEDYRTPGAEHLHYIQEVYASLYILIDDRIYEICCKNSSTIVTSYLRNVDQNSFSKEGTVCKASTDFADQGVLSPMDGAVDVLKSFCYTVVTNYSLYAFNSSFFTDEATDYKKEELIRRRGKENRYDVKTLREIRSERGTSKANESRSWLQGLFVKNDGYQAPIVIAPMRESGRIDIQKEYKLAKERMLSLIFMQDEEGVHYFNRINGKLIVDGVFLIKDRYFEIEYQKLDSYSEYLPSITKANFRDLFGYIRQAVISHCSIENDDRKDHHNLVWIYIVQKLIKIIFIYPRYANYRSLLLSFPNVQVVDISGAISEMVGVILRDHSHVTRKLYRSIYYLQFDHIAKKKILPVDSFSNEISTLIRGDAEHPYLPFHNDELLPPSVFHTNFRLYHTNDTGKNKPILFNTLSSGEKQITYTLSTLYYHLANLDSVGDVHNPEVEVVQYKYVMAIFDEIELYFHPEMQRTFISYMLDGLKQMKLRNIEGIQIMMATHSPFILSDIPQSNVLFLNKDGYPVQVDTMCTFGANIHSMLKNSFFLRNGTMGAFAQEQLNECFNILNIYTLAHEANQIKKEHDEGNRQKSLNYLLASNSRALNAMDEVDRNKIMVLDLDGYFAVEAVLLSHAKNVISFIQEPLLKQVLEEQLSQWEEYVALEN